MIYAILDNRYKLDGFDPNFEVRVDFAEAKLNTITERGGTLSSLFDIEFTSNNRKTLEALNQLTNKGERARRSYAVQLFDDDKMIFSGTLVIEDISRMLSCRLFGGGVSVFQAIGDKSIREIDLSAFNHVWSAAEVNSRRTATQGVVYPNINHGRWTGINKPASEPHTDFFPAVYVKTLIQQALAAEGYTVTGLDNFQEAVLCGTDSWQNNHSIREKAVTSGPVTRTQGGVDSHFHFATLEQNNTEAFFQNTGGPIGPPDFTQITFLGAHKVKFRISGSHTGGVGNGNDVFLQISQILGGSKVLASLRVPAGAPAASFTLEATVERKSSTQTFFYVVNLAGQNADKLTLSGGTSWEVIAEESEASIPNGGRILIQDTLPDISVKELVKYAATKLNALVITDSREKSVTFKPLNDVASEINRAKDWTAFEVDEWLTAQEFQPNDYAQENTLRYKVFEDESGKNSLADGRGTFFIDNNTLKPKEDVYEAPFYYSFISAVFQNPTESILYVPKYSSRTIDYRTPDIEAGPRVVEIEINDDFLITITGQTAPAQQANAYPVTFQEIVQGAYSALSKALNNYRLIKAQLLLPRREVEQLDFTRPIYFKGAYCYLRLIRGYNLTNPEPTQVELIKLR